MARRPGILTGLAACGLAAVLAGCSTGGEGKPGLLAGKNVTRTDQNVRVYLDGREATQTRLDKGIPGYEAYEIKAPISTSPVFRYELVDMAAFGTVKRTTMQLHRAEDDEFSELPTYVIVPKEGDCFAPDTSYDLGALGDDFTILNAQDQQVDEIKLAPDHDYLLIFTVQADGSERLQVAFRTAGSD